MSRINLITFVRGMVAMVATREGIMPYWSETSQCFSCERNLTEDMTEDLNGELICSRCINDGHFRFCEDCDGYYPSRYADDHDHYDNGDGCCESPAQSFSVVNAGNDPLPNDRRAEYELAGGIISDTGMRHIMRYLMDREDTYELGYHAEALDSQWQTPEGNFTKRLCRRAHQLGLPKLPPDAMSQVGTIAREHSNPVAMAVEVTRDFNQPASYFAHDGSCYWGGYSESRCVLKSNGAFALRSFGTYGDLSGRAWVMPMKISLSYDRPLKPTFDALSPDAFVVFNGYGELSGYAGARIMSHMAGMPYHKIGFECEPMFVNAGGYLVSGGQNGAFNNDGTRSIYMSVDQHSSLYAQEMGNYA